MIAPDDIVQSPRSSGPRRMPDEARARAAPREATGETLVVGGGVSGLYAALLLARRGRRVRVIERAERAGGLAAAQLFRGVPCDLGSHRLHPEALERPLFRELHAVEPLLVRERRGVLVMGDRHVPYPPRAGAMLRALGLRASLDVAFRLLARERRRAFARWDDDRTREDGTDGDVGFERFVVERVGLSAYRAFYEPYARKVWGLPPSELSQTVAKKRVSTTRPWSLLASSAGRLLRRVDGRGAEAPERFVYPARGIASIVSHLERSLAQAGGTIEYGHAARAGSPLGPGPVFFAGDLRDLVASSLEHRGLYLVYLALPIARASGVETYYAPDPRYWFGRVSELQNYSPTLRKDGETILCVEIPEGTWGTGIDFTGDKLVALLHQLEAARIIPSGVRPVDVLQRFVPNVYPLYRRGWRAEWRAAMQRVASLGDVFPVGRQALFLHRNLDHCADIAEDAVEHVLRGGDAPSWIEHAESYLDLRVRD